MKLHIHAKLEVFYRQAVDDMVVSKECESIIEDNKDKHMCHLQTRQHGSIMLAKTSIVTIVPLVNLGQ